MGLDITYYSKCVKRDCVINVDGEPIDLPDYDWFKVYINPDFPGRADEFEDRSIYSYAASGGFRAGGYIGYNSWREQLALMAGYKSTRVERFVGVFEYRCDAGAQVAGCGPFYELIWFADNEGVLGTATSAKLAKDFAQFQADADRHKDDRFRQKYNEWRQAFEKASDGGCVRFH